MLRYLGYVGSPLGIDAPMDRTVRLVNASDRRLRELIASNLDALARVLRYDVDHGIYLQRISSRIVPFASHPGVSLSDWARAFGPILRDLGGFIRANGIRVSMHPGHFTLLNAPDPAVRSAALRELDYHVAFLEALGLGSEHKIVVHVGGVYGDHPRSLGRFVEAVLALPESWRRRLVVEHDERSFGVEDVLLASNQAGIPAVFDWLHYRLNPGPSEIPAAELIARCFATWRAEDGPPKTHYSAAARAARPGAHADWADPDDFREFLRACPPPIAFDCMLECKRKDLALLRLREQLRRLGVISGSAA